MRCKNCGYENDDKLYICENCGSPLYDEDEVIENNKSDTMVFNTKDLNNSNKNNPAPIDDEDEKKKKQSIITIVVLSVVLISIIIGIVVGIASRNKAEPNETTTPIETTTQAENKPIETTKQTTTTTTTTTTEAPTEAEKLDVILSCNAGGEVEGDGQYELGENVTIFARPDDGYEFSGWYNGNTKVSTNTKYTFTVTESIKLKAVFIIVQMEESETESTTEESTTEQTTSDNIENIDGEDD